MSENIVFPCPACGTKYSVSPHHAGKKTTCKKCGAPVTVPSPQVANPTIVGGTRTIRRADIDPGASAREEMVGTNAGGGDVDMTGGDSVLRKEETVIGAPPMVGVSAPSTRAPARRPGTAGPRPAPAGRPMPPGMAGPPRKKNNMPMLMGIGGGVVGLILIVVLVVVVSNPGSGSTGDDGTVAQDGSDAQQLSADERLLADMRKAHNNIDALSLDQVLFYYEEAGKRADNPEFKSMQSQFSNYVISKAESDAPPARFAEIALMFDDAGHPSAEMLLQKAMTAMERAGIAIKEQNKTLPDGSVRKTQVADAKFKDIVTRLGWKDYEYPEEMNLAIEYGVEGAQEYSAYYNYDVPQVYRDVKLFPPELVEKLKEMEEVALGRWSDLVAKNDADGFAFQARKAWIRFKQSQDSKAKVDREKGKRSFSPIAMERESEDFDNIWTYTYHRPFMVYVEKELGQGQGQLDPRFVESLESKSALLRYLYDWFRDNLIDKFNLQRVKPQYNAAQAELEGWPMEIVVLKDRATFEKYAEDVRGRPMPGARAFYSPLDERVMTYDDTADMSEDTQWFNESVLIHETFHQLSDHYAANPHFTFEQIQERPRYANVLIQEGLTDSVSGFVREGSGKSASYKFLTLNHLRLDEFKSIYELLDDRVLFRIRDTILCRHYGQCEAVAGQRALELKINPAWAMGNALGIYYPTVCQIGYFFQHYKEGGEYVYRDKWWEYIALDYTGKINLTSYADNRAIAKFKEVFDINSDSDWDALEKTFLDYTLGLEAENVGKGGEGVTEEDTVAPGSVQPPPHEGSFLPEGSSKSALPSREEEEEVLIG